MELKAGQKLFSAVNDAQFVVVKAPGAAVELAFGGQPLLGEAPAEPGAGDGSGEEALLGKRYADDDLGIELLCARGGAGALTVDGNPLGLKGAKPLPSSD